MVAKPAVTGPVRALGMTGMTGSCLGIECCFAAHKSRQNPYRNYKNPYLFEGVSGVESGAALGTRRHLQSRNPPDKSAGDIGPYCWVLSGPEAVN